MKLDKRTYQLISAFSLLLFLSSILLPVSVSAATLFCDMEMEAMAQTHSTHEDACCDFHDAVPVNQETYASSSNTCVYQQVCAEAVSSDKTEKQAILQFTKSFVATLAFTDIFIGYTEKSNQTNTESETIKPQKNQPIFLLNSTFLN